MNIELVIKPSLYKSLKTKSHGAFMQPVIMNSDAWLVETSRGEEFVVPSLVLKIPAFIVGMDGKSNNTTDGQVFEFMDAPDVDEDSEDCGPFLSRAIANSLSDFMPEGCHGGVMRVTIRRNVYVCRLTASGYLDSTDWELHDTGNKAARSLLESM